MTNFTRRRFLELSAASASTVALAPGVLSAEEELEHMPWSFASGKAEHVIMFWLGGGACHIDTWDPKKNGRCKGQKAWVVLSRH